MPVPLWNFQEEAVQRALARNCIYNLFFEMGLGKTRTAIAVAQRAYVDRIVVVAPISAIGVWARELGAVWPEARAVTLASASIPARADMLAGLIPHNGVTPPTFVLINYEAYWREPLRTAIRAYHPQMIIYDEVHRLKNKGTKQSRFAHQLFDIIPMRLGLSGSPITHGFEDLYSIYRAVDPSVFGRRWVDFSFEYIIMGGYQGRQIVGYRNKAKLGSKLRQTSTRVTKAEALSLPEELDVTVPVTLSRKSQEYYFKLKKKAIAEVEGIGPDGQPLKGTALARIVLTNILRLQTITSGFVKIIPTDPTQDPGGRIVDLASEKLNTLEDMLRDVEARAVVFCRFTRDVDRCAEMITDKLKRHAYVLDGRVPFPHREARLIQWNGDPEGVIVGQIGATALGLDFTAASVAFYYSLDFDLTHWIQTRARLHRHGQRHPVTYYALIASGTIDQKILAALLAREDLAKSILDKSRSAYSALFDAEGNVLLTPKATAVGAAVVGDAIVEMEEDSDYLRSLTI